MKPPSINMRYVMCLLAQDKSPFHGCNGRSQFGVRQRVIRGLILRRLVIDCVEHYELTELGRKWAQEDIRIGGFGIHEEQVK